MGRLLFLCLIVAMAHGCGWLVRREATPPQRTEPRSDRLREVPPRSAPGTAETPARARSAEPPAQPKEPPPRAPAPAEAATPAPSTADPDPSAVVDWLLKQRR